MRKGDRFEMDGQVYEVTDVKTETKEDGTVVEVITSVPVSS